MIGMRLIVQSAHRLATTPSRSGTIGAGIRTTSSAASSTFHAGADDADWYVPACTPQVPVKASRSASARWM